jgi:trans-aconitate 2-methyltransferase
MVFTHNISEGIVIHTFNLTFSQNFSIVYTWDPADYRAHSPAQRLWAEELVDKLCLCGNERILDLGCGDGRITAEIAARVPEGMVVGVDNSREMIGFAREHFPSSMYPNLSFEICDIRTLPVLGEFHVAFSNAALHWVPEQVAVLEGVRDNLACGGRLLFQMGGKGNASRLLDNVLPVVIRRQRWRSYFKRFVAPFRFFGDEEYIRFLKSAGLVPGRVQLIPKDMVYPDRGGLEGWIRTTWLPYTQAIPEELRDIAIREIIDKYLEEYPPDPDGTISVPMVRLEVEACARRERAEDSPVICRQVRHRRRDAQADHRNDRDQEQLRDILLKRSSPFFIRLLQKQRSGH